LPGIFEKWDWFKFLFCCSCLLGFGGYFGLWISLFESLTKDGNTLKLVLLFGGLISILFILYNKQNLVLHLSPNFEDIGRLLLFLWPAIVSVILIIKILTEKKSNFKTDS
jgi:hypothetical protein